MPAPSGTSTERRDRGVDKENIPKHNGPPTKENICKFWSDGRCRKSHRDCFKVTPSGKVRLYHRCDVELVDAAGKPVMDPATNKQKVCGGVHKRADHK